MPRFPITFLSTYKGKGYMELDENMTLVSVTDEEGNEIPAEPPYSYRVTDND